VTKTAVYLLC